MTLTVTPIYAALLAGLFLWLSARVIRYRRGNRLSLGDEGDRTLLVLMRAQANFTEYAPLAIVLLLIAEVMGTPALALHLLGLSLLAGRICHAIAFGGEPPNMRLRVMGMVMTLTMIALTALGLLLHAIF